MINWCQFFGQALPINSFHRSLLFVRDVCEIYFLWHVVQNSVTIPKMRKCHSLVYVYQELVESVFRNLRHFFFPRFMRIHFNIRVGKRHLLRIGRWYTKPVLRWIRNSIYSYISSDRLNEIPGKLLFVCLCYVRTFVILTRLLFFCPGRGVPSIKSTL